MGHELQNDNVVVKRRPDIVIINKMEKTAIIIDVAIAGDKRIIHKEKEKIEKYQNLKRELHRLWNFKACVCYFLSNFYFFTK